MYLLLMVRIHRRRVSSQVMIEELEMEKGQERQGNKKER